MEGKVGKARGHFLSLLRCSGVARCVQSRRNVSEEVGRISCLVFVLTHVIKSTYGGHVRLRAVTDSPHLSRGGRTV